MFMFKVNVNLRKKLDYSYRIYVGSNVFDELFSLFISHNKFSKIGVVTDSNLQNIYLARGHFLSKFPVFSFPAGEKSKNIATVVELAKELIESGFDRKSLLVAFGGGVVGDVAGFLASIYMRGIQFVQVPTSLLAMVDSSIGGKTGVDTEAGKNLIGTFYQPELVVIDTSYLKTLPPLETKNGIAEILKHGIIFDRNYFSVIEKSSICDFDPEKIDSIFTQRIIARSCEIKGFVVSKDEKESGLRQILNFGHTVGHGLEKLSNYDLPHGICVAIGMLVEAKISKNAGILSEFDFKRIKNVLEKFSYLDYINEIKNLDFERFFSIITADKKNVKGGVRVVLIDKIGKVYSKNGLFSFEISKEEIKKALYEILSY